MAFVVLGREIAVDLVDGNGVVTQQNVKVKEGARLPDNVSPFLISALKSSGVIAYLAESPVIPTPGVREVEPPAQVRTPDQPMLLPSDPVGNRIATGEVSPDEAEPETEDSVNAVVTPGGLSTKAASVTGDEPSVPPAPKASDTKDVWEDYAAARGMDRGQAESMSKKDLMAEVARIEQS